MSHKKVVVFALCCITLLLQISQPSAALALAPKFSLIFAFEDSIVDSENNNLITTLLNTDHHPYVRALPDQATSDRFFDIKLTTDYISSFIGMKNLLSAYLDMSLSDANLLGDASFASVGTKLNELTVNLADVLDLDTELYLPLVPLIRFTSSLGILFVSLRTEVAFILKTSF